jgi:hypothetical protein
MRHRHRLGQIDGVLDGLDVVREQVVVGTAAKLVVVHGCGRVIDRGIQMTKMRI